jgi:hypothetical protein
MEEASANWLYDEIHKERPYHDGTFRHWSSERTPETPCHYRDGVTIWVAPTDLNPEDRFLSPSGDGEFVDPPEAEEQG